MNLTTKMAVEALLTDKYLKHSNTEVREGEMIVCGTTLARLNDGLYITDGGFRTILTKERLNGLPGVNLVNKKGWILNGERWDGSWIKVW